MPKEINIKKIKDELDKGTLDQQYTALQDIKDHIHSNMETEQKEAEERANSIQSKMDKIKQ